VTVGAPRCTDNAAENILEYFPAMLKNAVVSVDVLNNQCFSILLVCGLQRFYSLFASS
jgi:hypothetical protein